jgi:ribosomal large subunit pseudouridine synthase B (EC 5.4.99.-)
MLVSGMNADKQTFPEKQFITYPITMATIKIAKFLSEAGIASRRKAETLITQGLIFVNGKKNG